MQITSREDALMYLKMETQELQRESDRLQAKIDAIKLEAMEKLYALKAGGNSSHKGINSEC